MARHPERMAVTHPRLFTVRGDILDATAVQGAISAHGAVVIAIGMGLTRKPVTLFSPGTKNVLAAMEAAKIHRLVAVTGMGAGETREHGGFFYDRIFRPLVLRTVYEDKDRQEALIKDYSNSYPLLWTIVRPGALGNGEPEHRYRVISDLTGVTGGKIARSDVAHFIVAVLECQSHIGQTPLLIN
jgi:putative NADH-flavin reductase